MSIAAKDTALFHGAMLRIEELEKIRDELGQQVIHLEGRVERLEDAGDLLARAAAGVLPLAAGFDEAAVLGRAVEGWKRR